MLSCASAAPRSRFQAMHHWPRGSVGNGMSQDQSGAAMRAFLHAVGMMADDFDLQLDKAPLRGLLSPPKSVITVRRRSTGIERLYKARSTSSWLAELLGDVEAGLFGAV